ncbi:MAG: hypothetical protein C0483_00265 [Pirellula sp.]|nr:hypothetical protein [Pirellula sp.]
MATDAPGPWEGLTISGGRYERLTTIGVGGMGYVYRAVDRNLKTDVVIKAPRASLVEFSELADRFEQEVGALVRLSFPHIVPIIDIGRHAGVSFAVMRYLPGGNLRTRAMTGEGGRQAPMPWQSLRYWLPSIAKALDFVHRSQFVHRDVKPRNILFDEHGQAYLSDFGIIKGIGLMATGESRYRTADGINVGTVDYMAPEILKNQPFDGRADQYSLALTVYEFVAGRLPFSDDSVAVVINGHLNTVPQPLSVLVPDVPASISAAVSKALLKDPAERFRDCGDFARAVLGTTASSADLQTGIRQASPSHGASAHHADAGETRIARSAAPSSTRRFLSSRSGAVVLAGVFAAVAALVLAVALDRQSDTTTPSEIAEHSPLARQLTEWKRKAGEVERSRTVESEAILSALQYDNAAQLQQLLKAKAASDLRDYSGRLDELEGELTAMAQLHSDRAKRLAESRSGTAPAPSGAGQASSEATAQDRELQDQASELTTMAHRLRSLKEKSQSLDAFDAAALQELTLLNEMEALLAAPEHREVGASCLQRATDLALGPNPSLAWTAVNVLARSGDSAAVKTVVSRFNSYPPAKQWALLQSLFVSGGAEPTAAALRLTAKYPKAMESGSREELVRLAERDAKRYRGVIDWLLQSCTSPDERLRIFVAQTQALSDEWLKELEVACTTGLLSDHVDEVFDEIVLRKHVAAYPLAERLARRSPAPTYKHFTGAELPEIMADGPSLGAVVAGQWILQGSDALRAAALAEYCRPGSSLDVSPLAAAFAKRPVRDPESLINLFIKQESTTGVRLAAAALNEIPDFQHAKILFTTASVPVLHSLEARQRLLEIAWDDADKGRSWALVQMLGAGFLSKFDDAEAVRKEQLSTMREIIPILSGKLVILPNSPVSGPKDRGLSVAFVDLFKLPNDLDPKKLAPDGPSQIRLSELRADLAQLLPTVSSRFAEVIKSVDRYLVELEALNRSSYELATIYDFTVQQQLPGVRRAMQVNPTPTWDFRFASSHITRFERERTTFQALTESLPKSRSSVPLPQ